MTERKCGTCSACCRWPSIKEINKPARTPCMYLHSQGFKCTIYENRPKTCSSYQCSWLKGKGANKDRPDTCDILMDRHFTKWGYVLVAKQLKPDAARTTKGSNALMRAGRDSDLLVVVVDYKDTDLIIGAAGPAHLVEAFQKETKGIPVKLGTFSDYTQDLIDKAMGGIWPGT